ncbi:MarR family transcriptional regulator [Lentzea sp. E54]|uniref:MarR family transcriptional regulator n=1 Tax=Lentzea xerophila TaxID=3435883 RepID=UPI003DA2F558
MPRKNNNARLRTPLHVVPDAGTTAGRQHTAAEDKLWRALHSHPGSTAAELADQAAIGRSTAGKILAAWATDGSATRMPGIAQGGRRAADTWTISALETGDESVDDDGKPGEPEPVPHIAAVVAPEPAKPAADDPGAIGIEPPELSTVDAASGGTPEAESAGGPGKAARLGKGALRGMVEDFLAEHASESFSPGAIAKVLSRSSGAVANAVDKLVADGYAVKVQDAPKRYTAKSAN